MYYYYFCSATKYLCWLCRIFKNFLCVPKSLLISCEKLIQKTEIGYFKHNS